MVTNQEVHVFVNECFEASLRILAMDYSIPNPSAVDDFLVGSIPLENQHALGLPRLFFRAACGFARRARQYVPDAYKFYDAVVEHFRQRLTTLDQTVLRDLCEIQETRAQIGLDLLRSPLTIPPQHLNSFTTQSLPPE